MRATLHENFIYPDVKQLLLFIEKGIAALTLSLSAELAQRIKGIGIAMPNEIWNWPEEANVPTDILNEWKEFDYSSRISEITHLPVFLCNDDSAACSAELSFGNRHGFKDFFYVFIGTFIGGGVVIGGIY